MAGFAQGHFTFMVLAISMAFLFSSAVKLPSVYIAVDLDIEPTRFCSLARRFRDKLSRELIEARDGRVYTVSVKRIRIVNPPLCLCGTPGKEYHTESELVFYISKNDSNVTVDKPMTVHVYEILRDYWKNRKMREIDEVFMGKVKSVSLRGDEVVPEVKGDFTDEDRVWIGIGFGLSVIITIAVMRLIVAYKNNNPRAVEECRLAGIVSTEGGQVNKLERGSEDSEHSEAPPPYTVCVEEAVLSNSKL